MSLVDSLQTIRQLLWLLLGSSNMREAVDDAAAVSRMHRPFGPESTPRGLPPDVPVYSGRGFRRRPEATISPQGDVSLIYSPREEFDTVVAFYNSQLPARHWAVTEVYDDTGHKYRARRFDVQKGTRQGTVAVEELVEDLGPIERRSVTVTVDIPCWE